MSAYQRAVAALLVALVASACSSDSATESDSDVASDSATESDADSATESDAPECTSDEDCWSGGDEERSCIDGVCQYTENSCESEFGSCQCIDGSSGTRTCSRGSWSPCYSEDEQLECDDWDDEYFTSRDTDTADVGDAPDAPDTPDAPAEPDAGDANDTGSSDAAESDTDESDTDESDADAGVPDLEAACVASGGTVATALCCTSTEPFPDLCSIGACSCGPADSAEIATCDCGEARCFDGASCVAQ